MARGIDGEEYPTDNNNAKSAGISDAAIATTSTFLTYTCAVVPSFLLHTYLPVASLPLLPPTTNLTILLTRRCRLQPLIRSSAKSTV